MMRTRTICLALSTLAIAGCASQPPAPVVSGYHNQRSSHTQEPQQSAVVPHMSAVATPSTTSEDVAEAPASYQEFARNLPATPEPTTQDGRARAHTYFVQPGDTLYSLSKRFDVSVAELQSSNKLTSNNIGTGDVLIIPVENHYQAVGQQLATAPTSEPQPYRLTSQYNRTATQPPAQQMAMAQPDYGTIEPAAGWTSPQAEPDASEAMVTYVTHRVKKGETLYRIGQTYKASVIDIMAANDLERPQDLIAESMIRVPVSGQESSSIQMRNRQLAQQKGLVWPAQGKVLKSFGEKGNGVTHTGISILLPENTPIAAAENGTVIYADDGLRSYGNLVLLRHDDGLVTAYAHNNRLMVRKNQRVTKGDTIALSGATGSVVRPQLHFEVRRNARAIDPVRVLPKREF